MRAYMAEVYDVMIIKMTALWYKTVLTRLGKAARGSPYDVSLALRASVCRKKGRLLDVGIALGQL